MFFAASILIAGVASVAAQGVSITSPTITQCGTSTISFEGGSGPYYVAILKGDSPCESDAYAEYYDVQGNSVDYLSTLTAGTPLYVYVADASDTESWSELITVAGGDDTSCLTSSENVSSSVEAPSSVSIASYVAPTAITYEAPTNSLTINDETGGDNSNYDDSGSNDNNSGTSNASTGNTGTNGASTLVLSSSAVIGAMVAFMSLL